MGRYIPHDKMSKLREAAKNGDEMAKKILRAQLDDTTDFSNDLENYFKPKEEPKVVEEKPQVPAANEQQNVVAPVLTGQLPDDDVSKSLLSLIHACDDKTIVIANDGDISDATKKGALSILSEIKQSCIDNLSKFSKLMNSISKKDIAEEE